MYSEFTFYFIAKNRFTLTFKKLYFLRNSTSQLLTRSSYYLRDKPHVLLDELSIEFLIIHLQKNFTQQKTAPEKIQRRF